MVPSDALCDLPTTRRAETIGRHREAFAAGGAQTGSGRVHVTEALNGGLGMPSADREGVARPPDGSGEVRSGLLGVPLAVWRTTWSLVAGGEAEEEGDASDLPAPLPAARVDERIQRIRHGIGPLFHRRYSVVIESSSMSAEQVMAASTADLNHIAHAGIATFDKIRGMPGRLSLGDEYVVRMSGPWTGPVRVVSRTGTSFRLATLRGHMEAGQIEFRVRPEGADLCFEIESWARCGDPLLYLLYQPLGVAKDIQRAMWVNACRQVVLLAGGRPDREVTIRTRRLDRPPSRTRTGAPRRPHRPATDSS